MRVRTNFGRVPFEFGVPAGCTRVEHPDTSSDAPTAGTGATWLSRFEHAADTTRVIASRQPLSSHVTDLALRREVSGAEAHELPMEIFAVKQETQIGPFQPSFAHNQNADGLLEDTRAP